MKQELYYFVIFHRTRACYNSYIVNHLIDLNFIFVDYSGDWFMSLSWETMLWLSVSVILKNKAALQILKRRKFRPKMRQNAFGGRAPPGPAGGA